METMPLHHHIIINTEILPEWQSSMHVDLLSLVLRWSVPIRVCSRQRSSCSSPQGFRDDRTSAQTRKGQQTQFFAAYQAAGDDGTDGTDGKMAPGATDLTFSSVPDICPPHAPDAWIPVERSVSAMQQ